MKTKKPLSYPLILGILALLFLVNICPVLILQDRVELNNFSLIPAAVAVLVLLNGLGALLFKHVDNYFNFGTPRRGLFTAPKEYTYTEEYEREFRWMMLVYFAAVPFYIPCICFSSDYAETAWTLVPLAGPQLVFMLHGMYETVQHVKTAKAEAEQRERELREQEQREELGVWRSTNKRR